MVKNYGPLVMVRRRGGGYNAFRGVPSPYADMRATLDPQGRTAGDMYAYFATAPGDVWFKTRDEWEYIQDRINSAGWDAVVAELLGNIRRKYPSYGLPAVATTSPVVPTSPPIMLPPITATGGALDGTITLPVIGTISKKTALIGAGIAAFFFLNK